MVNKYFILNADNFGQSKASNIAVLYGYHNGFLKSASLSANGSAFNAAVNEIIPECPKLGVGVHLNITNGKSLTKAKMLTNKKGIFNNNFLQIAIKSCNKNFLKEVEFEFRTQIETIMNYTKVDHIDSNKHIHSIPALFEITARLAKEYNIEYVRNTYEELYFSSGLKKYLNINFPINISKLIILNLYSIKNQTVLKEYNLKSNNNILGICYSNIMDNSTIESGLEMLEDDNYIIETIINPNYYNTSKRNSTEYLIACDKELKDKILRLGFEISAYKDIKDENN